VAAAVAQVAGQVRAVIVPASVADHGYPAQSSVRDVTAGGGSGSPSSRSAAVAIMRSRGWSGWWWRGGWRGVLSEGAVQSSNVSFPLLVDHYLLRRLTGQGYPDR
jgi:hypothetical protein